MEMEADLVVIANVDRRHTLQVHEQVSSDLELALAAEGTMQHTTTQCGVGCDVANSSSQWWWCAVPRVVAGCATQDAV